jgi:hypothetical protein
MLHSTARRARGKLASPDVPSSVHYPDSSGGLWLSFFSSRSERETRLIETRTYKRTKQVAAELGVSVQTLQRMVRPAYDISQARQGS